ncbi:MAG: CTP synthase [Oscillospiraceae bacterium]|jgi:CTP synthase|nr:CTP synthase [Oscillospiraceae bacterium]
MSKFVFVTGGVVSGVGKGVTAASLGCLLKRRGLRVAAQKLDPYINVDPGTMSPYQHGEVFVTEDGTEADLDLGHYERFIDENLTEFSNLTAGKIYSVVIGNERRGEYLGNTVQVIPHVTNEVKKFIYSLMESSKADVVITEIGGTVGDMEIQPFLEAIRQIAFEVGAENCLFIHVTLVPFVESTGELKSKPTQHSVRELRAAGINPNIIVTRSRHPIGESLRDKIALFCNVKLDCVIENYTLSSIYHAPVLLEKSDFSNIVVRELGLKCRPLDLSEWKQMLRDGENIKYKIKIAIVGKYVKLRDAYLSVAEALNHAGFYFSTAVEIKWIDSELLTDFTISEMLGDCNGILVPGGFGSRGIDGMICAVRYARENNVPFLGICLGMQVAVIEFARNVLGISDANSSEFDPKNENPVIDLMEEQRGVLKKGGTMRLGSCCCHIKKDSLMESIYGKSEIFERHRHRYEFNNKFREQFETYGMTISGLSPNGVLVESVEIFKHRFFVAVQFHPEFKSRPNNAHPLFREFVNKSVSTLGLAR